MLRGKLVGGRFSYVNDSCECLKDLAIMFFNIEFARTDTLCSCYGMLVCLAHVHMLQVCCLHGLMQGRGLQEVWLVGSNVCRSICYRKGIRFVVYNRV